MTVLFEEHPTKDLHSPAFIVWPERRVMPEPVQQCARLSEYVSVVELDGGDLSHRIDFKKFGLPRLAPHLRHLDPAVGDADPTEDHLHLVHVSRLEVTEQSDHPA
jgi:hypothetical protein